MRPHWPLIAASLLFAVTLAAACTSDEPATGPSPSPTPEASPTPTATSEPRPDVTVPSTSTITVAAVGDLMFARDVTDLMLEHGAEYPFERVLPLFQGADLLLGNLEGTFTDRGQLADKTYTFRAPPELAEGLALAGFDAVSLANNHSFDFGPDGLADTLDALDVVGVAHFGAGLSEADARAPALLKVGDATVALLGLNNAPGAHAAAGEEPGVAQASQTNGRAIEHAAAIADYVIVTVHAGTEYVATPTDGQREFAHRAIDAGADVVIGHHPHVLQPWERYKGGLILYSLGNFVFDLDADDLATLGSGPFETAVAVLTLSPDVPPDVEFRPAYIDVAENRPRPATPDEAGAILAALTELHATSSTTGPADATAAMTLPGHPPELRTGDATVDTVVDAVLSRDVDALLALARFADLPCALESPTEGYGPPPICPEGVAEGTLLPVMMNAGCHGVLRTPEDLHHDLRLASPELRLYAVATPTGAADADAEHFVLFAVRVGDDDVWGYGLVTGRDGFTSVNLGCAFSPEEMIEFYAGTPYLLELPR